MAFLQDSRFWRCIFCPKIHLKTRLSPCHASSTFRGDRVSSCWEEPKKSAPTGHRSRRKRVESHCPHRLQPRNVTGKTWKPVTNAIIHMKTPCSKLSFLFIHQFAQHNLWAKMVAHLPMHEMSRWCVITHGSHQKHICKGILNIPLSFVYK